MSNIKKVLITGFTGMDGSVLAQQLLQMNPAPKVYGLIRRSSNPSLDFIEEMGLQDVELVEGDLCDSGSLQHIIKKLRPDELYNFAAQSHVHTSFDQPEYTLDITGGGVVRLLEQIRLNSPDTKFYQAGTSELWGDVRGRTVQNESTPFNPMSPYAAAKAYSFHITKLYREAYGLFTCNGILTNHEHYRRSKTFVTRKITNWVANYMLDDTIPSLKLGNLYAKRDWGYAGDFCKAAYLMLQQDKPDDYVIGTGVARSVKDFCNTAFHVVDINIEWHGNGVEEKAYDTESGKVVIEIDPKFYRPAEVNYLCADFSKAKRVLGWYPTTEFEVWIKEMIMFDVTRNLETISEDEI